MKFRFSKYVYLVVGILFTAILLPQGLALLNVKLPTLLIDIISDNSYSQIEDLFIILGDMLIFALFIVNIVIMFIKLKQSSSKTYFRLSIMFALLLPVLYKTNLYTNIFKDLISTIDAEFTTCSLVTIIISTFMFLLGTFMYVKYDKQNEFKPTISDFLKVIIILLFNVFYLVGYKNLFMMSNMIVMIFIDYFMISIYCMLIGIWEIIAQSKK